MQLLNQGKLKTRKLLELKILDNVSTSHLSIKYMVWRFMCWLDFVFKCAVWDCVNSLGVGHLIPPQDNGCTKDEEKFG